jgi:cell division transport system permease protein
VNPYHLRSALAGLWKEKWIHFLSVVSIAVGLFIITLGFVTVYNLHHLAVKLPERFSITAYLNEDAGPDEMQALMNNLKANLNVQKAVFISRENALAELKKALKDSEYLLEGLDENPLPASIEIKLKKDFVKTENVKRFAGELKNMKGISEVQYGEEFLNSIQSVMSGARLVGIVFLGALLIGIIFVCYSTVKILFYRRADEVETLKLLGATRWFIRAPFLLEGSLIGLGGGLLAVLAGLLLFEVSLKGFAASMPVLRYFIVPQAAIYGLPLLGLAIGFAGALVALGRIRF